MCVSSSIDVEARNSVVVVIGTAGTILSREHTPGRVEVADGASALLTELPDVAGVTVQAVDFATSYPRGWDLSWSLLCDLGAYVEEHLHRPEVAGVVVTHGTDVLEEVAHFLTLTLASEKPVVVTGAMRNQSLPGFDGLRNLHDAVLVAADEQAAGRGAIVCMNGKLFPTVDVTKGHTTSIDSFVAPNLNQMGWVEHGTPTFSSPPARRGRKFQVKREVTPNVPLVWTYACSVASTFEQIAAKCDGIVIAGTGLGHVPSTWAAEIQLLLSRGVPVVIASRSGSGSTGLGYVGTGGDFHLAEMGALFAGSKRPLQARMELMSALSAGMQLDEIRDLFPMSEKQTQMLQASSGVAN